MPPSASGALLLTLALFCAPVLPVRAQDPTPTRTSPDPNPGLSVANAFLDAPSVKAKAGYVRDAARVTPLMQAFYDRRSPGPLEPARNALRPMPAIEVGGLTCLQFHVPFNNGTNRLLTIVPTPEGLKVDWECYARYSPVPWDAFLAGMVARPSAFRVFLQPSDYYNYQFADREKFSAYRLSSPDVAQAIHGYVIRDSQLDVSLRSMLKTPGAHRVILELLDDNGSGKNSQVIIKGLVETSWVVIQPTP